MAYPNPEFEIGKNPFVDARIGISQELDLFGKRTLRGKRAKNEIKIYESNFDSVRAEVSFKVKEVYAKVLLAEKTRELADETLALTRKLFNKVQERFNLGKALRNELLRVEIEMFEAQNELLVAEKNLFVIKAELNILLGREYSHKFVCTDELAEQKKKFNLDNLIEKALLNRPDLKTKELMLDSKNMEVRLAKKEIFANPFIGFSGEREDREQDLGINMSISLPLWDRKQGEIAEARNELQKIEGQINSIKRQIRLEVNDALGEVVLADKQVDLWKKAVRMADELIRLTKLEYEEGKITFLIHLEHLKKFKETKLSYFNALNDYQMKLAILEKTVGGRCVCV
jgi:cobalt-zinc-cadmium efflux system outer membrane protein